MTQYDPKYDDLIDAETWAFIRDTESWYPPDAIGLTIQDQRTVYDKMCRAFHAGHPPGVVVTDGFIAATDHNIATRSYHVQHPIPAQVAYLHGGGFVVGGLDSHDDVCAEICARTKAPVTAIDYSLSPEHHFPDDFNDALAAVRHLAKSGAPLVLVGDSAGGNLCAAISAALSGTAQAPIGQVLIYPGLGTPHPTYSAADHAGAPMLTSQDIAFYATIRAGGDTTARTNPNFSPLYGDSFANLPPTVAITAQCDPLSDDGKHYCDQITAASGAAMHIEEPGLVHGYLRARHRVARAGTSFDRIITAIATLARGDWPAKL